jgi:hypothetical protein
VEGMWVIASRVGVREWPSKSSVRIAYCIEVESNRPKGHFQMRIQPTARGVVGNVGADGCWTPLSKQQGGHGPQGDRRRVSGR